LITHLRFALRILLKAPSVTLITIISLALGIGATTTIFSMYDQVLRRPLPVSDPNRLVNLLSPGRKPGSTSTTEAGGGEAVFSYPMFRDLEKTSTSFAGIAGHCVFGANFAYKNQALSGTGLLVSGSYFSVLGLQPALGRLLGSDDDTAAGKSPVVVLSHAFWRTHFESSPAVLHETLIVNGQALKIIGVAPQGFNGTTLQMPPEVFVPITLREAIQPGTQKSLDNRQDYWVYLFARLKPGVSMEQALSAANQPYRAIINDVEAPLQEGSTAQQMAEFRSKRLVLEPGYRGQSSMHKEAGDPFLILMIVTGFVLLIACANIANLLLARAAGRTNEMAIRLSIGASRTNLLGQMLTESLILATLGGIAGLFVARWTFALVMSLLPPEASMTITFALDPAVLLFAGTVTLGAGLAFGLFPAIQGTRTAALTAQMGPTGRHSGTRAAARFRWSLATVQIAMSTTLLISAGLFTKSLFNISKIDLGMDTKNLIRFGLSPGLSGYNSAQSHALFERLETELAAHPGVTHVTASRVPVLADSNWTNSVSVEGFASGPEIDSDSRYNVIGAGYFEAMGIPLISGREFTESDTSTAPRVVIVNEQFAKKFNLGANVIGKRMAQGSGKKDLELQIVGLVRNAKYSGVKEAIPPQFFIPYRQDFGTGNLTFYVRGAVPPETLLPMIRPTVAKVAPNVPIERMGTMAETIKDSVSDDRVMAVLCDAFAALATFLAAIGLYGVLSYSVAQRTREFGVRMALGADRSGIRGMVLRQVALMAVIGGGVGLAAARGLGLLGEAIFYEMSGYDSSVLLVSALLLAAVTFGAGFVPAHRASRVEPMTALRYE